MNQSLVKSLHFQMHLSMSEDEKLRYWRACTASLKIGKLPNGIGDFIYSRMPDAGCDDRGVPTEELCTYLEKSLSIGNVANTIIKEGIEG